MALLDHTPIGPGRHHAELAQGFAPTRAALPDAMHMPGYYYASREIFDLEKEKIFMRDWLCMGRVEEIPESGDYMSFRVFEEPLAVVRNAEGRINAFSNICRHRGAEVVVGAGRAESFRCPYHGWLYDLDGRLKHASFMDKSGKFDPQARMTPIRCETWAGWIFINFDDNAAPLSRHTAGFEQDFGELRMQDCGLAGKLELEFACNWKLLVENIVDIYHFGVLHPTTVGRNVSTTGDPVQPRPNGGYYLQFHTGTQTKSGKPLFGAMPWLEDKPSGYSVSGLLPPNFTLFAHRDDTHPIVTWPLAPDRTRIVIYTIMPWEFFSRPRFREKLADYTATNRQILEEDRAMIESLQKGVASRRFVPGPMSHFERGIHHIISSIHERLFAV